jgi:hypothetical protein
MHNKKTTIGTASGAAGSEAELMPSYRWLTREDSAQWARRLLAVDPAALNVVSMAQNLRGCRSNRSPGKVPTLVCFFVAGMFLG